MTAEPTEDPAAGEQAAESSSAPADEQSAESSDAPAPSAGSSLNRDDAKAVALAAVGEGGVTWSGREDERGAAWEIEITRPDGSEIDVLIDAEGAVVT